MKLLTKSEAITALMRPNPVRDTLRAGGTPYRTMAIEFSSPGLIAILAEVGADFVLPPDGASAIESLIYLGAEREC